MTALRRETHVAPQKSQLTYVYLSMVASGDVEPCAPLRALLVKKSSKSQSGVLVRKAAHQTLKCERWASHTHAHADSLVRLRR